MPVRRDGDLVRGPARSAGIAVAMFTVLGVLAIVVASDPVLPPYLQGVDDAWRRTVLTWPGWTRRLGEALEQIGAGSVMVPLRIVVAAWLALRRRRWDLAAWLLGWVVADALTWVLKPGLARERPTATDARNPFTSFPSAHAKTAAQMAVGLVLVATSPWAARRRWYGLAAAWTALMALSRTVVDHHWLSDVVADSLLGTAAAVLAAAAVQLLRERDRRPVAAPP